VSAVKGPNNGNCAANDEILRHECILTLDGPAMQVIEVTPRVAAVYPVVPHHEEMAAMDDNVELDGRWLDLYAAGPHRQIGRFIESLAINGQPLGLIATDDVISREADNPLDQVLVADIGQYANELKHLADRAAFAGGAANEPSAWISEDNHVPAFDAAEFLDNDAIIDLQGVLHRDGRNQEHLADKASNQRGNDDRADDDSRQFFEEGPDMLAEAQMLRVGRTWGLGLIAVELRYRLQGAPRPRLTPPVGHIGLPVISLRRAFP
jgi:hypothetical protein